MTKPKRERAENKIQKTLPKIQPLPGAVCAQKIRCGKPNCKCAKGELHEGYFYHFFYVDGKLRKKYVKKADVPTIKARVLLNKQQMQEMRTFVREINQASALMRLYYREVSKVRL
jgi:hypothetical protein